MENPGNWQRGVATESRTGSKTRHGDGQHQRAFNPTAQATHNEHCPVQLFKSFASHLVHQSSIGKKRDGKFRVKAAKAAHFLGNISNHSVRKTCIPRPMDADVSENYLAQLSGHKPRCSIRQIQLAISERCQWS